MKLTPQDILAIKSSCVFVIDDEEIITDILSMYLEEFGFTDVHVFNDSVEAIDALRSVKADLVLTDINMPGLGGNYLTRLARDMDHLSEVAIVAITADQTEIAAQKLLNSGAMRVLHKPIDPGSLLQCAVEALSAKSIVQEMA